MVGAAEPVGCQREHGQRDCFSLDPTGFLELDYLLFIMKFPCKFCPSR